MSQRNGQHAKAHRRLERAWKHHCDTRKALGMTPDTWVQGFDWRAVENRPTPASLGIPDILIWKGKKR